MVRVCLLLVWLVSSFSTSVYAESVGVIEEVVVIGVQPGPKMWRVNKGDHELWIFGTLSLLPKKMQWDSQAYLDDRKTQTC